MYLSGNSGSKRPWRLRRLRLRWLRLRWLRLKKALGVRLKLPWVKF